MRTMSALTLALTTLVAGCGGSKSPSGPSNPNAGGTGNTVTVRGVGYDGAGSASFQPGSLTVNRGTMVTWQNSDSITHSVVSATPGLFNAEMGPSGAFEFRFDNAGSFPYSCVIHAGMSGSIIVRP